MSDKEILDAIRAAFVAVGVKSPEEVTAALVIAFGNIRATTLQKEIAAKQRELQQIQQG